MAPSPTETEPPQVRPIGYRRPERSAWLSLFLFSVAIHLIVALGLTFVLTRHYAEKPEEKLDLGIDVTLGEAVQELIVTQPSTEPPAPVPVPPLPTPPEPDPVPPEPTPEPPPVMTEKPEFVEPVAKAPPKPPAKATVRATPAKPAGAPPGAKVGLVARDGVVGGNVTQGKLVGTPGGQKIGNQGWRTPTPPYPPQALASHIQGSGEVRITTDAAGAVRDVTVTRPISPILDSNTRAFARGNWKGPPNATRNVPVVYRIP